ncbi:exocyst complex component 6B-like isoform X2 [Meriones unguiculatus]|uniref:exocyst complex component 6B-like isoform X2 n=1 Tax=Meriones unguiculatus TaxID=10047 RepID=UPI00293E2FC2|nr:exocyst complex component 6B-like isoform X2 [Meriones unguiculatus]
MERAKMAEESLKMAAEHERILREIESTDAACIGPTLSLDNIVLQQPEIGSKRKSKEDVYTIIDAEVESTSPRSEQDSGILDVEDEEDDEECDNKDDSREIKRPTERRRMLSAWWPPLRTPCREATAT